MMFTVYNYFLSVYIKSRCLRLSCMRAYTQVWSVSALWAWTHVTSHVLRDKPTYMSKSRDPLLPRQRDPAALCGPDCGWTVVELLINLCKKWEMEGGRRCSLAFHAAGCFFESLPRIAGWQPILGPYIYINESCPPQLDYSWLLCHLKIRCTTSQSFTWQWRPFIVL